MKSKEPPSSKTEPDSSLSVPSTVNYHLYQPCNFKCKFCFATFNDVKRTILPPNSGGLSKEESIVLIEKLAQYGFKKINFAGGEPTLVKHLPELVKYAAGLGLETSIVTNGSKINREYLKQFENQLHIVGLSIDSLNYETNKKSGRYASPIIPNKDFYASKCEIIAEMNMYLKVNTVVHRYNIDEVLSDFILEHSVKRWKIFKVLRVEGQNDEQFDSISVSDAEFKKYLINNNQCSEIIVDEDNEQMRGSYIMIDPAGRFYDSTQLIYTYSNRIIDYGVNDCLNQISYSCEKFLNRKGNYSINDH